MVKRIFAVIGIVLGGALLLLGSIVGVMALMGKFKAPVIYPESLVFQQSELMVDTTNSVKTVNGKKLYSFTLTGSADAEFPVNRTECYIQITKGRDIITLCNENGDALIADKTVGNKFLINCNSPVYYYINTTEVDGKLVPKYGNVEITASDKRGTIPSSNNLSLSIDSEMQNVFINTVNSSPEVANNNCQDQTATEKAKQEILIGVGDKLYLNLDNYIIGDGALKPFNEVEAKPIELYFVDDSYNYYIVDSETVTQAPLNEFIKFDNTLNSYYLISELSNVFKFEISYFPTYNAKQEFETSYEGNLPVGEQKVRNELLNYTVVNVSVSNTYVEEVHLSGSINLGLYLENYVSLSSSNAVTGTNNLGLTYSPSNSQTDLRYNEVIFMNDINLSSTVNFVPSEGGDAIEYNSNEHDVEEINTPSLPNVKEFSVTIEGTTFTLQSNVENVSLNMANDNSEERYLITSIKSGETEYKVSSGALIVEKIGSKYILKVLGSGTYLGFFEENYNAAAEPKLISYNLWNECSVEIHDKDTLKDRQKTWKVIPEELNESLSFMALVVNNTGTFTFAIHSNVNVKENELNTPNDIDFINKEFTLNIDYEYDEASGEYNAVGDSKHVSNIFKFKDTITYKAGILLVESSDAHCVKTLETAVTRDGTEYKIVGDIVDDKFVNKVIATGAVNKAQIKLTVLQLENAYGQDIEQCHIDDTIGLIANNKQGSYFKYVITVNFVYDISILKTAENRFNSDIVSISYSSNQNQGYPEYKDGAQQFVEGSNGHILIGFKIDIKGNIKQIFANLTAICGSDSNQKLIYTDPNPSNVAIEGLTGDANGLIIDLEIGTQPNDNIEMMLKYGDITINMDPIKILSKSPTGIDFNYGEGTVELTNKDAQNIPTINATISYDTKYTYTWKYKTKVLEDFAFDDNFFKITPNYAEGGLSFNVYDENNEEVDYYDSEWLLEVGTYTLEVTVGTLTKYAKIEVKSENFVLNVTTDPATSPTNGDVYTLEENSYYYNSDLIEGFNADAGDVNLDKDIKLVNINDIKYGNDKECQFNTADNTITYLNERNEAVTILTATQDGNGIWKFERVNEFYSTLKITVQLKTRTGTHEIPLSFEPNISVNTNTLAGWEVENGVIYAYLGTTAKIYQRVGSKNVTTNAMFKIVDSSDLVYAEVYKDNVKKSYDDGTSNFEFDDIGEYTVKFFIGSGPNIQEMKGSERTIKVIPNVVVNVSNTTFESNGNAQDFFTAYSYNDIIYGSDETGSTIGAYPKLGDENFDSCTSSINNASIFTVSGTNKTTEIKYSETTEKMQIKISAEEVLEIGTNIKKDVTISYNSENLCAKNIYIDSAQHTEDTVSITIYNPYEVVSMNESVEVLQDIEEALDLKLNNASYTISNIKATGLDIIGNKVTTHLSSPNTYDFVITFENDYTLHRHITVYPYTPTELDTIYSEQNGLDVITAAFDLPDTEIKNIKVLAYINENGDRIESIVEDPYFNSFVFNQANSSLVSVKSLNSDSVNIKIVFEIEYNSYVKLTEKPIDWEYSRTSYFYYDEGDRTYKNVEESHTWGARDYFRVIKCEYAHPVTIENRDSTIATYPYNGVAVDGTISLYEYTSNAIADKISTLVTADEYEPVIIGQTIDLLERITIEDRVIPKEEDIASIKVYAVSFKSSEMATYLGEGIVIDGTKITFKTYSSSGPVSLGYIQFKITTKHGKIDYYTVRLFNQKGVNSNFDGIDVKLNKDISVGANGTFEINTDTGNTLFGTDLDVEGTFKMKEFDSTKVSMYLIGVNSPATITTDSDNVIKVGEESLGLKLNQKLNAVALESLEHNYVTLKVALLYKSGTYEFCFGTATLFVQPTTTLTDPTDSDLANTHEYYNSGFFTKTITTNMSDYNSPFTGAESVEITGEAVDEGLVTKDGTSLKFPTYSQVDNSFTAKYKVGDTYYVIEFTLQGFILTTDNIQATVGKFDNEEFNNSISLQDFIKGVNGSSYGKAINIKITKEDGTQVGNEATNIIPGAQNEQDWKWDVLGDVNENNQINFNSTAATNKEFTFPQTTKEYTVKIYITFVGYKVNGGEYTKTITVNVLPGIYVDNQSTTNPIESTKITNYRAGEETNGSQIGITLDGNKYSVYYSVNSYYDIYFSDNIAKSFNINYEAENSVNYVNSYPSEVDATEIVYFPHMSISTKVVELKISFDIDENVVEQWQSSSSSILSDGESTLYVKLAKTYDGLTMNYLVSGADNENVVGGTYQNYYAKLFETTNNKSALDASDNTKQIFETNRISLKGVGVSLGDIGFNATVYPNNPNNLKFTINGGTTKIVGNDIFFDNELLSSTDAILKMETCYGVSYSYKFHILPKDVTDVNKVDAIKLEDNTNINTTSASFVVGENGKNGNLAETTIGQLYDGGNNNIFAISSLKYNEVGVVPTKVSKKIENNSIIYTITIDKGEFTITLDANKNFKVKFDKTSDYTKIKLTFNAYGDTSAILENYSIILYNLVAPSGTDLSVNIPGESTVDASVIKFKTSGGGEPSGITLTYNLKSVHVSDPIVGVNEKYVLRGSSLDTNNYISYEDGKITTKLVYGNPLATLKYEVKDGTFVITEIDYQVTIINKIVLVVNGKDLSGNTWFSSDFELKNSVVYDTDETSDEYQHVTNQFNNDEVYHDVTYNLNNPLSLRIFDYGTVSEGNYGTLKGKSLEAITLTKNKDSANKDCYEISKTTITFLKDFTTLAGEPIIIDISYKMDNGTYVIPWEIDIVGLETVEYNDKGAGPNKILNGENQAFEQGSSVNLISTQSYFDTNIVITKNTPSIEGKTNEYSKIKIEPIVDYVVTKYNSVVDAKALFEDATTTKINVTIPEVTNEIISVDLPNVPQKSEGEYWNVTYRISLRYLGAEHGPYYITYKVMNSNSFSNGNTTVAVVDGADRSAFVGNDNKTLNLFTYREEYSKEGTTHATITSVTSDGVYKAQLSVSTKEGTNNYIYHSGNINSSSIWLKEGSTEAYKLETDGTSYTLTKGIYESGAFTQSNPAVTITGLDRKIETSKNTLLSSDYNNILEFLKIVNDITSVRLNNLTPDKGYAGSGEYVDYKLNLVDSVFKIDLSQPINTYGGGSLKDNKLFNNSLTADFEIRNNSSSIFTIKDFKITTSNAITPKGKLITFGDIFTSAQMGEENYSKHATKQILGIGEISGSSVTASKDWVNNASADAVSVGTAITTIDKHESTNQASYLWQVKYTGKVGALYNLTKTFYVLATDDGALTVVNYANKSSRVNAFQVGYTQEDFSMADAVLDYKMNEILDPETNALIGYELGYTSMQYKYIKDSTDAPADGYKDVNYVTITNANLDSYKMDNPTASFLTMSYTPSNSPSNSPELKFNIMWELGDINVTANYAEGEDYFEASYEAEENQELALAGMLKAKLDSQETNNSASDDLKITGVNGSIYKASGSKLEIPTSILQNYKNENPEKTYLQLTYMATFKGKQISFNVRWDLPEVVINYNGDNCFIVNYDSAVTEQVLDIENLFKYYEPDTGILLNTVKEIKIGGTGQTKITKSNSDLIAYKADNPTHSYMEESINVVMDHDNNPTNADIEISITIRWILPVQ